MFSQNRVIKVVSAVPVILITFLFCFEFYVYNFIFILKSFGRPLGDDIPISISLVGVLFNALWLLAFCSYLRCSFTDPGFVTEDFHAKEPNPSQPNRRKVFGWNPGVATKCGLCNVHRPERAHHCRICGKCVMRMDHHCPWVGTCIGIHNHKYFILMNVYGFLSCVVFVASAFPQLSQAFMGGRKHFGQRPQSHMDATLFSLGGLLAASFGVSLSILGAAHVWLLLRNLTSIEIAFMGKNPYKLGWIQNAIQLLGGPPDLTWMLPISPAGHVLDGFEYPVNQVLPEESAIIGAPAADLEQLGDQV